MPGELWCTTTNPSSDIAISVMDDTREKIRLHLKKKKSICIHMLMFSLSFYLPLLLYYEPCSVSRVISAYACSSVPAPGSALTSVAVFATITRGSFHTALGLQRDIGAQRD